MLGSIFVFEFNCLFFNDILKVFIIFFIDFIKYLYMYLNKLLVLCMDLLCFIELINFVGNLFCM